MSEIRKYLETHVSFLRDSRRPGELKYSCVEDFVLQHGRAWPHVRVGGDIRMGRMRECYRNAMMNAVSIPGLTYVEGIAFGNIVPFHHAWCVDEAGAVMDPTFRDAHEHTFFGVAYDTKWAWNHVQVKGSYGVVDDWERRFPILRGEIVPVLAGRWKPIEKESG